MNKREQIHEIPLHVMGYKVKRKRLGKQGHIIQALTPPYGISSNLLLISHLTYFYMEKSKRSWNLEIYQIFRWKKFRK